MKKLVYKAKIVAVLLICAFGIPFIIPDGTSGLAGEEKIFAEYARSYAYSVEFENPLFYLLMYKIRIGDIKISEPGQGCEAFDPAVNKFIPLSSHYSALVTAHTIFGLPITWREIECEPN